MTFNILLWQCWLLCTSLNPLNLFLCFFPSDMDSECRSHVHDLRLSLAMGVRQGRSTAPSQGRPSILGRLVNPSDQGTSVQPAWPPLYPCTQRTDGLRRCGRNPGAFLGSLGPPRGGGHAQGLRGCRGAQAPGTRPAGRTRALPLLDSGDSWLYFQEENENA